MNRKEALSVLYKKLTEAPPGTDEYLDLVKAIEVLQNGNVNTSYEVVDIVGRVLPAIISGMFSMAQTRAVLHFEETGIVTSKAYRRP